MSDLLNSPVVAGGASSYFFGLKRDEKIRDLGFLN